MPRILLVLSLLLPLASAAASDLTRDGITGKVKRFAIGQYYEGKLHARTITLVDATGNFTEAHTFDAAKATGKTVYVRDEQGRQKEIRYYKVSGELLQRLVYQYKEGMEPVASVLYDAAGTILQTASYNHTADGMIASITGFTTDQKKMFEVIYTYDADRRLTGSRHLNFAGNLFYQVSYEYEKNDSAGNWIQRTKKTWSLDNELLGTEVEKRAFEYY